MTNIEAFKIWAKDNVMWSEWAKPVLFANMKSKIENPAIEIPGIKWLDYPLMDAAIIVDLPGENSVKESLALACLGYRPVPLYNGVCIDNYTNMTVDVRGISSALYAGTQLLADMNIRNDAPPAFMLDSRRMWGYVKNPGMFDNRWCVFPQDMPSALFLKKHNIKKIIVRTGNINDDLSHILRRYQEAGLKIQIARENEIKDITVSKPSMFKSIFYRLQAESGLSRNAVGGFGTLIPHLDDSGGYTGIG